MNLAEHFVTALFKELLEENSERYRSSLRKIPDDGTDNYAKARKALAGLSDAEKNDVLNFIDVVIADSASVILGTLDGSHFPDDIDGDFTVTCNEIEIQGSLQDLFIEKAEGKGVYD